MRLSLAVKGVTLAETELGGPLLLCPGGLAIVRQSSQSTVLEPAVGAGDEAPDLLVGEVPLVWWEPSSRAVEVSFLEVPAPPPFAADDVSAMWERLLASSLPTVDSLPLQGRASGRGRRRGNWMRPEAVPRAHAACRRILGSWPELESVETIWRPADMPGGREDLVETDRRAGSKLGMPANGVMIPDRVARRHRSSAPWRSSRLGAACRSLAGALRDGQAGSEDVPALVRPVDLVAERAGTRGRYVDPPVSSWPQVARATLAAVLDARIAVTLAGKGANHVPLSHVWRLYEHWLVTAVADALRFRLGPGEELAAGSAWRWQWTDGTVVVRVHAQATIGATPNTSLSGHPDGLVSVLSDLRPDVLITVSDRQGGQAVVCVDAKRRTAGTSMDPSEVAGAASKYVWGIRSGSDPDLPLASTIIASSARLGRMHDVDRARVTTRFLLPSVEGTSFRDLVGDRVAALIASVRSG